MNDIFLVLKLITEMTAHNTEVKKTADVLIVNTTLSKAADYDNVTITVEDFYLHVLLAALASKLLYLFASLL